ncbi:hypothetical protein FACS1894159_04840 [Bacteroidia bacterium]|nr:hypothetical protein FACS1894159_04840 [Bacteroidia bacterium]
MSDYKAIADEIYNIGGGNIIPRKKNPIIQILILLAGIALIVVAYGQTVKGNTDLSNKLLVAGILVGVTGLSMTVFCLMHKGSPYHKPSGERLRRTRRGFDFASRDKVVDCLTRGDFAALEALPEHESEGVIAIVYRAPKSGFAIAQAQEFVPHYYLPITDILLFEGK